MHREGEARTRVLSKAAIPQPGELWSAGVRGRSKESSICTEGLVHEQAWVPPSTGETEEGHEILEATISTQSKSEKMPLPVAPTARTLPATAPAALPAPPMGAVNPQQPSDTSMPPIVMISRRREQGIVSKALEMSEEYSPGLEAARERSWPLKSVVAKDSSIPRVSFSPSVCAKIQKQSVKTVLDKELPKGSSLTGGALLIGIVSAPLSSDCGKSYAPTRRSVNKVSISTGEDVKAARRSPISKAAFTLHKAMPVYTLRVSPASPSALTKQLTGNRRPTREPQFKFAHGLMSRPPLVLWNASKSVLSLLK
ncbi:hypothetical protein AX14_011495 [Amanita brunnescens Koide BX004]|nr:hypothetical protein AX14_011495 [Amanita brunnescens Koide BX004]